MRTQLTLELLGKLDKYDQVFDHEVYRKHRPDYLAQLASFKSDDFLQELRQLAKEKGYTYPLSSYIKGIKYSIEELKDILRPIRKPRPRDMAAPFRCA